MKTIQTISKVLMIISFMLPLVATAEVPKLISTLFKQDINTAFDISLEVPEIAEDGSKVRVEIKSISNIPDGSYIKNIALYNEFREDAVTNINPGERMIVKGLTFQIKMKDTGNIYAVATLSNGDILTGKKLIKVTIGGCGGP